MIPKPLGEITWSDILALQESGREEDDTIEYKESLAGGLDYQALSSGQKDKARDTIAKEVIAFLNGRGGDIVIGVQEGDNDLPKIKAITPLQNVDKTVGSLADSLAAIIEPRQAILAIRAIREHNDDTEGVIIIRAPSSLRAPHRSTQTKEDRKSTRLNSSHVSQSRMPSSA